ncbi:MAG: hypothetical protein KDD37_02295 [Bdellovibrionales bacterium]|nr:hypothetical protein [Bdellovibrionales bacterium]
MKQIVLISILLLSTLTAFAHTNGEELTEAEYIEATLTAELGEYVASAHTLSNTILDANVDANAKCSYLEQLRLLLTNYDMATNEYARFLKLEQRQGFGAYTREDADQNFLKLMFIERHRSEWIHFNTSVSIFARNLDCK